MSFNLLVEPWIPVLYHNGQARRVNIRQALTEAGSIRQIAASNPMDNVALLRFLLAVLQWCKPTLSEDDVLRLARADGIPEDWLQEKLGRAEMPNTAFDLLHATQPFYQDPGVRQTKPTPATNLLHEVPSGTNIVHFRHVRDFESGLCLACCAVGLVRWSAYASAGTAGPGQSMTAAPNGNTPPYCVARGRTFLASLKTAWRMSAVEGDRAVWDGATEGTALGPLKGFTWRSRRVHLAPLNFDRGTSQQRGVCLLCGRSTDDLVRSVCFRPGWKRPAGGAWAADPHLLRVHRPTGRPLIPSAPGPNEPLEDHATIWQQVCKGVLGRDAGSSYTVLVASSQQLYKDAHDRHDEKAGFDAALHKRAGSILDELHQITWATTSSRSGAWDKPPRGHVVAVALRHEQAKALALRSALAALAPSRETQLDRAFGSILAQVDRASDDPALRDWRELAETVLRRTVKYAVRATTPGSPLRRREAALCAEQVLSHAIRKLADRKDENSDHDKTEKPKRQPRKRDQG